MLCSLMLRSSVKTTYTEGYLPRLPFSEPRNEMLSIHSPADRLQLTPAPAPSQLLTHRCLVELAMFADRPCLGSLALPTPVTICLSLLLQSWAPRGSLVDGNRPGDHSTPRDILTSASSPGDMCWMDRNPPTPKTHAGAQ